MAEVAERTIVVDRRTGTTNEALWAGSGRPLSTVESFDVDDWLDAIASGRAVGSTSEATVHHHPRPGVTYRPNKDGPRIPVRLAWRRDEPAHGADGTDRHRHPPVRGGRHRSRFGLRSALTTGTVRSPGRNRVPHHRIASNGQTGILSGECGDGKGSSGRGP